MKEFTRSSALEIQVADHMSAERFLDKAEALMADWHFEHCKIEGVQLTANGRARISYQFEDFSTQRFAKEEVKDFAEACGAWILDRKYGIE